MARRDIATIAQAVVRLHVLDHLANAVSFPRQPTLPVLPRRPFPIEPPRRLKRVSLRPFWLALTHSILPGTDS